MTQVSDNNWMEEQDELTFCPDCTEYQITAQQRETFGCCAHCATAKPMPIIDELISNAHVIFLDAPKDAQAFGITVDGEICWYKNITPNSYQFIHESSVNKGDWLLSSNKPNYEPLVYRPVDVVESPEEREYFERLTNEQQVDAIAAIVRTCPTNSATGIAHLLVAAGCSIDLTKVQK
ncbi:hypothetical protein [Shewanella sp.]|uniref:hypothetical protein n=1 Tax=Shewanella sp. TaxID=50422 RepID=UPI0040471343